MPREGLHNRALNEETLAPLSEKDKERRLNIKDNNRRHTTLIADER